MSVIGTLVVVLLGWLCVAQWRLGDKLDKLAETKVDKTDFRTLEANVVFKDTCAAKHGE